MAYIKTLPEDQAEGLMNDLYQAEKKTFGYVPNFAQVFGLNPEAYDGWKKLSAAVRSKLRLRQYELVTLATAMVLKCSY